ncbi:MAG TPA: ATP synthase F1 subunit gamma [Bacteroidales bacterium]|nr:ATP synthase F1 subunit gamma [Bacteroidales bacterium]
MTTLVDVRTRIATVKTTRQITSAMKLVSSTKLMKAQRNLTSLRPFEASLLQMVKDVYKGLEPENFHKITLPAAGNKVLVLIFGSNKGLCGTYNVMIIRKALDHIQNLQNNGFEVHLLLIGSKVADFFIKNKYEVHGVQNDFIDHVNFQSCSEFGQNLVKLLTENTFDRIDAVYSKFRHALIQEFTAEQILPLTSLSKAAQEAKPLDPQHQEDLDKVIFEPSHSELTNYLVPKYFETLTYVLTLNTTASEHGARMTAMQKSTDNATELLKNLSLAMNKVRQSVITREIMEIVSGAESMKN